MRRHVIVGVINISTDVDKLYDTDLSDAGWAPSGQEFQDRPRKTRSPRRCAPTLPYVPNYLTCLFVSPPPCPPWPPCEPFVPFMIHQKAILDSSIGAALETREESSHGGHGGHGGCLKIGNQFCRRALGSLSPGPGLLRNDSSRCARENWSRCS